ncbi:MAG: hypothetical protein ACKOBW_12420 [Planctomycetota bacterium]
MEPRVAPADLHYSAWAPRDAPWRTLLQLLVSTILVVAVDGAGSGRGLTIFVVAALLLVSGRQWFPVWYEIGPAGIVESTWWGSRRVAWSQIARWRPLRDGALLLPDWDDTPLAAWRGRWLPWNGRREPLLALLEFYVPRPVSTPTPNTPTAPASPPTPASPASPTVPS